MDRIKDWKKFSEQMEKHINVYTIPQYYSDNDEEDQVGAYTSKQCIHQIRRYTSRHGKENVHGNLEAMRDMFKIAHYAQIAYEKLREELGGGIYED